MEMFGKNKNSKTLSNYQEICEIKDRLYRDIARLETLLGTKMASSNVNHIATDVLGPDYFKY